MKTKSKDKSGLCPLRSLLLMVVVMCASIGWAKTYTVEKAGTLRAVIGQEADTLSQIKVIGSLDESDLRYLGNLAHQKALRNIDILDTDATVLPSGCFSGSKLEHIILPKNLTHMEMGSWGIFQNCEELISVQFPNSVKEFPFALFCGCKKLETFNFPDSLVEIGHRAFALCKSLKNKRFVFPETVKYIDNGVLFFADGVEEIVFPQSVEVLYSYQIAGGLKSLKRVVFPKSLKEIDGKAFSGCDIETLEFPEDLEEIHQHAFKDNKNLTQVVLPASLKTIHVRAFKGSGAKKLFIPAHLDSIGSASFKDNPNLSEVYCTSKTPPRWGKGDPDSEVCVFGGWSYCVDSINMPFDDAAYERATLYIPQGTLQAYQEQPHWAKFQKIVEVAPGNWPPEAAVNEVRIDHGAVVSQEYINLEGRISATPFEGVNIVRNRHADGHVSTTKVIK